MNLSVDEMDVNTKAQVRAQLTFAIEKEQVFFNSCGWGICDRSDFTQ